MKKILIRVVLAVVVLLVVAVVVGAMFLGSIIRKGVETVGPSLTKIMDNVQAATGGSGGDRPQPKTGGKGAAKKLQVDDLVITSGRIHLSTILTAGKPVTVPLPDIHFTNLGEGPDGITAGELTRKVLGTVTQSTLTAAAKRITDLGKGAVDAASGTVKDAGDVGKAVKGVGDLFKKK